MEDKEAIYLLLLQFGCFTLTTLSAIALLYTKIHAISFNRRYEMARWHLFGAMLLLSVHYLLQMVYGFREQGDDIGALVNLLFYAPTSYLVSAATITLVGKPSVAKRFRIIFACCYAIILITFGIGWQIYGSLRMPIPLYIIDAFYLFTMVAGLIYPIAGYRRIRKKLETDSGADISALNFLVKSDYFILVVMALLTAFILFNRITLAIFGSIFLLSLFCYVISFICMGFYLSNITDVLDGFQNKHEISPNATHQIDEGIAKWIEEKGYRNPGASIVSMAESIQVSQADLSHYLTNQYGVTFRVWLSKVRIDEAKRIICEHPNFNNEIIANELGFSSRTYFQNVFKEATGFTPREWSLRAKETSKNK